jgi:phage portal protein BeeE
MRRDGSNFVEWPEHPVQKLIRDGPNRLQSWADWTEWLLASSLAQGYAIAVIDHDQRGAPTSFYPIPAWCAQALLVPARGAEAMDSPYVPNSRLCFDITMSQMPWQLPGGYSATGFPRRYFADGGEILYLKDRSDDGIIGRSRLSRSPGAIACGLGAQGFSEGIWQNGAVLDGVLKHPGRLGAEAVTNLSQSWRSAHSGGANAGKIMVLEEDMTFEKIGVSPEDAELLDSRKFSVVEICRLFNVPPMVVGDFGDSNFATSDAAMRFFATGCLAQWIAKLQGEFARSVFNTPDAVLRIDLEGLLRGDFTAHAQALINLTRTGIISADEARHELGWNPRGGDADKLQPQAVGGRPSDTPDGGGDTIPPPGGNRPPGIRPNGSATLQ